MKKLLIGLLSAAVLVGVTSSQEHHAKGAHTMKGYLVDQMCGKNMAKADAKKAMMKARKHTRECAMEEECAASGYGLMSDGKYYPFDAAGTKQAAEYLKNTKKESNIEVEVVGTMDGGNINVEAIHDVKTAAKETKEKG